MVRSRTIASLAALAVFLAPALALAAGGLPAKIVTCTGVDCSVCDLAQLAQNVLNTGIYVAVFLSAILFAYAGFKLVTAGGSGEQVSQARSIFTNVAIGLVIILAGWLVVDTLMKTLVPQTGGFGPWNRICSAASAT